MTEAVTEPGGVGEVSDSASGGTEGAAGVEGELPEKRVTNAELFFDLVFVLCVTQVSAMLHARHDWAGVGRALVVLVPLYWAWVGTSIQASTHDVDNPVDRVTIFAIGLGGLFMALAVPQAYGGRGLLFGCAYLAVRLVLAARTQWLGGALLGPFGVGAALTGPLLVLGGLLHGGARTGVWALAAAIDLSTPALTRRHLKARVQIHPGHLPERFSLFVLIALGETIVSVGEPVAGIPQLTAAELIAVAVSFVLISALWWVYFAYAADAMRHAVTTAVIQVDMVRQVLSYAHLSLVGSIIAVAVGLTESVEFPGRPLSAGGGALLLGGCALYLATFGYTRWRMFRLHSMTRLVGAAVMLCLLPAAPRLPALATLSLQAGLLVGLNLWEQIRRRGMN
ncbi:low temperature requirement protein A [Streptacidiphilus sp. N1-3]|uniref:Low temperature requirement protein A n=1 Tax=Streptacidiphilus alkalitolerans TaxID=3342712 RepID=A0ABV6XDM0_9ACTN